MQLTAKNIPFYTISILLFLLLKYSYGLAKLNHLDFLLYPIQKVLGWFIGTPAVYISQQGYYFNDLHIIINKACAGFNFLSISFLLFSFLFIPILSKIIYKLLAIVAALLTAYILTLAATISRIYTAIFIHQASITYLPNQQNFIHEGVGIITYFIFLIAAYYITEQYIIPLLPHEKPTQP